MKLALFAQLWISWFISYYFCSISLWTVSCQNWCSLECCIVIRTLRNFSFWLRLSL